MSAFAESWPARFTVGYLAKRAGMSRHEMLRLVKEIPGLAKLVRPRRWTKISLVDLQACAPTLFDSIRLRHELAGAELDD